MQTKFRNGREVHEIREEWPTQFVTECGRENYSPFRVQFRGKVTCLQCLEKIEKKETAQCPSMD